MNNIFSASNKSEKQKVVVSAYIPIEIMEYLNLYCMSQGIPKSMLIKEQLEKLKNELIVAGYEQMEMIDMLVKRALTHYNELNKTKQKKSLSIEGFLSYVKKELNKSYIDKKTIELILTRIKYEAHTQEQSKETD
jgi:hypothetical protein